MFSPTIATVARLGSGLISEISPDCSSTANSSLSTLTANSASAFFTANDVLFSLDACDTRNTLTPFFAKALKIRAFIPIMPTIPKPDTVIKQVSLIEEIPLIAFPSGLGRCSEIHVPGAVGLNVFLIQIGIFL